VLTESGIVVFPGNGAKPGSSSALQLMNGIPYQHRSRNVDSFIAVNIAAPNNQQHIPGISHHG
jgi:hypothetical protein